MRRLRQAVVMTSKITAPTTSLDDIEAELWRLLRAYQPPLVDGTIYGMPSLIWPGAKGHAYFAAIKRAAKHVSLFLIIVDAHPEALEGASEALIKRRTGKATFSFPRLDPELAADLKALLDRLFAAYRADHGDD